MPRAIPAKTTPVGVFNPSHQPATETVGVTVADEDSLVLVYVRELNWVSVMVAVRVCPETLPVAVTCAYIR
jgi:hypothetical protein